MTAVVIAAAARADGQTDIRHIRGIIHQDETWSDHIIITDDVTIEGGTVTVSAGTTIEFANMIPGHTPTLTVGGESAGDMRLNATAEKPIRFRTRPGTNAGRVVVHVRSRILPIRPTDSGTIRPEPPTRLPNDVAWQHIRFKGLGYEKVKRRGGREVRVVEPAVTFNVVGSPHSLGVVNCTFDHCTRLLVRAADGARITLVANRADKPNDRVAIEIYGREGAQPAGPIAVRRNTLAAAISLHAAPATVMDNVLIGLDASIVVERDDSAETRIAENYVHNTTSDDDGRYCMKCENPDALIENNVFRGGTTCVRSGSRRMIGNILIAAPRLSSKIVKQARTHQLVYALPTGAVFEHNLLLGPAYSLLIPHPLTAMPQGKAHAGPTIIRNNLFDGFANSNRAVHLNPIGRLPVTVVVHDNVFLRIPTLVHDEAGASKTLLYADYNAAAPPAARAFDRARVNGVQQGEPGWSAADVQCGDVASLRLSGKLLPRVPDDTADGLVGKISASRLRQELLSIYRPAPESPLARTGRPDPADPDGARPSIGPIEPMDR